jgi:hypothetical protein
VIGWSTIAPVLQDVFSEIAINRRADGKDAQGGDPFKAEWIDGRKPWQDGKRFTITDPRGFAVGLTVTSAAAIGEDETLRELAEDGVTLRETQVGQRKFTLQVQALAIAGGVNADFAIAVTERARTRLTSRRIIDRLLGVDVSVISCGPSIFLSHRDGNRMVTSATMDVVFGCTAAEDDPVSPGWIQYVVVTSHLHDTDGTELEPALQLVNKEISGTP